jgi:hypothetical protein
MKKYDLPNWGVITSSFAFFAVLLSAQTLTIHRASAEEVASYDEETSSCDSIVCSGNFVPDNHYCECKCNITSCEDPTATFDPSSCSCIKPEAPSSACVNAPCDNESALQ